MDSEKQVFFGIIASAQSLNDLSVFTGYLIVESGKITKIGNKKEYTKLDAVGAFEDFKVTVLNDDQFLMPGFVDCHTHAPQFPNIGLGLDKPLLEWLDKYTFPLEKQYSDVEFAAKIYDDVVRRLLNNGTTTACYFGSIHLEGTLELVKSAIKHKQRALVGKVSMNLKNGAGYYNETAKELEDVKTFVKTVLGYKNDLVEPVITPRFAVSCDRQLMNSLSVIAAQNNCRIQSHLSENRHEINYVLSKNPRCLNYTEVYDNSQLLNEKCIMAHAIHLSDDELRMLVRKGVSIAHCPASNTRLLSGMCRVRHYLDNNLVVGLGTDVAGGDSANILDAMRRAMDVATHLQMQGDEGSYIKWSEVFYLATLGGAKALNLNNKIGSFEEGKEFDALLIDVFKTGGPTDKHDYRATTTHKAHSKSLVEKFIYTGDDRNIVQVYVKGVKVKDVL